jgi:hypothetical protein
VGSDTLLFGQTPRNNLEYKVWNKYLLFRTTTPRQSQQLESGLNRHVLASNDSKPVFLNHPSKVFLFDVFT